MIDSRALAQPPALELNAERIRLAERGRCWTYQTLFTGSLAACEHLAWWDDVNDLPGILTLTLLYCYCVTKVILPFIHWSEEFGELLFIFPIKPIVFIDTLSISDGFNDRDALIRLKCDDPEAQKRLWLHHIDRTPH